MAALEVPRTLYDIPFGFILLALPHVIDFFVNDTLLATFETNGSDLVFTCNTSSDVKVKTCITIEVTEDALSLNDYFYINWRFMGFKNEYVCEMKPRPGDGKHFLFLNVLLEYIATITGHTKIKLIDASTKNIGECDIPMNIFNLIPHYRTYSNNLFVSPYN